MIDRIKKIFNPPENERPINWPGFTDGMYIALYVVLLIHFIDILAPLSMGLNVDTSLKLTIVKINWTIIFLVIFGTIHILKIRRNARGK